MSQNQLTPTWMPFGGAPLQGKDAATSFNSDAVPIAFEDNVDIQVVWTGTITGTIVIQKSLDPVNIGWQTITFTPTVTNPAGSPGTGYYAVNQTAAGFIRLSYTAVSGAGTMSAKIAAKSL